MCNRSENVMNMRDRNTGKRIGFEDSMELLLDMDPDWEDFADWALSSSPRRWPTPIEEVFEIDDEIVY